MRSGIGILHLLRRHQTIVYRNMACSRYEYVKTFEQDDRVLPNVWIVVRIDGKKFHKFSQVHNFEKPNDTGALNLMNTAAITVMQEFRDVVISYGQSDEYSFVFRKDTKAFNRRASKLLTYVNSLFTSSYVFNWSKWMPNTQLQYPPCFDGRIVLYPSDENLRDYLSWRQADVHVNNLYNTAFWSLVLKAGLSNQEAESKLRGTMAADKNEILFSRFDINYNNLDAMFRKGTVLVRKRVVGGSLKGKGLQLIVPLHGDIISNQFWNKNQEILGKYVPGLFEFNDSLIASPLIDLQIRKLKDSDQTEEVAKQIEADVKT